MNEKELETWRKNDNKKINAVLFDFRKENSNSIQEALRNKLHNMSIHLSEIAEKQRAWPQDSAEYWLLQKTRSRVQNEIRKTIRQLQIESSGDSSGKITPEMIERAKTKPIEDMIVFVRGWSKCLWHDDSKPSMKLLPDNKVRCYVCNENHDAIDVFMILNGVQFTEAVRRMR
jgi:hypothetical protein